MHSATCSLPNGDNCAFTYTAFYSGPILTSVSEDTLTAYEDIILTGDFSD